MEHIKREGEGERTKSEGGDRSNRRRRKSARVVSTSSATVHSISIPLSLSLFALASAFPSAFLSNSMHSLAVRRAALVATRAASRSSTRGSGSNGSSRARALCSRSPSALSASLRQRTPPPLAASPPPPLYALSPRHRHIRCYASRKEEDKSWGEIAGTKEGKIESKKRERLEIQSTAK